MIEDNDKEMVECGNIHNGKQMISKEKLEFRPSVYGIIVHDNKILLAYLPRSGKYSLPGGGIDKGESVEVALKRELQEEAGIEIEINKFFNFRESFYYYEPRDEAYHAFCFFYLCNAVTFDLAVGDEVIDEEVEACVWVEIDNLNEDDFHNWFGEVFEMFKKSFK